MAKKVLQVVVMPYHGQAHMNTMLQFAKRLAWKGVQITVATTLSNTQKLKDKIEGVEWMTLESIYDDSDDSTLSFKDRMARFETIASKNLGQLLVKKREAIKTKCMLVYDSNLQWALDVAHENGVVGASYFILACATIACYYCMYLESQDKDAAAVLQTLSLLPSPALIHQHLPRGIFGGISHEGKGFHPFIHLVLRQFANLDRADLVLFNSFDKLEEQVVNWMSSTWNVKTIGPTLPSAYLDKRVENDVDYGFNQFKPMNEACMNWLNSKSANSVVYISFGSVAALSTEQMDEIAEALKQSSSNFLWVVREIEEQKLPANFISETSEKGLVLSWCPQLDVLAHESVGCFVSHCGWNSTIEALSFGVPVLTMPQFLDQFVDAQLLEQVWGVGITPSANDKGLVSRDEIHRCLVEIMQGERAEKIKENARMWKALAKEAYLEGGTSDKHIDEIIEWLASSK